MTRKPQPKLKPCPWCGEEPIGVIRAAFDTWRELNWVIRCPSYECDVRPSTYGPTRAEAVRRWNDRKEKP